MPPTRPPCSQQDAVSAGYNLLPCTNTAVGMIRHEGEDGRPVCWDCLLRNLRLAIDVHGKIVMVESHTERDDTIDTEGEEAIDTEGDDTIDTEGEEAIDTEGDTEEPIVE